MTSWLYSFDLLPEAGHARPAFINLQQYYVEGYLVERARELPLLDAALAQQGDGHRAVGRLRARCRSIRPMATTACARVTWSRPMARAVRVRAPDGAG